MSTEVKKIVIQMGKKDVELTLDEAKELRNALDDLFPMKSGPIIVPVYPSWPYRYWEPWYRSVSPVSPESGTLYLSTTHTDSKTAGV